MRKEVMRVETYFTKGQVKKLAEGQKIRTTVGEEHDGYQFQFTLEPLKNGELRIKVREVAWDHGGEGFHNFTGSIECHKMGQE